MEHDVKVVIIADIKEDCEFMKSFPSIIVSEVSSENEQMHKKLLQNEEN